MHETIDLLVQPLLDEGYMQCASVGILYKEQHTVFGYSDNAANDAMMPNRDTLFEIGSITKLFTRLLLTDMVRDGVIALDDPLSKFLPTIQALGKGMKATMTIRHLADHTSGLPRDAKYPTTDLEKPFDHFTVQHLYAFLADCELQTLPGKQYLYSNVGYGLLGHILEQASGAEYYTLLKARILQPLGMMDTVLLLNEEQRARLAQGHSCDGHATPAWGWDDNCPLIACGCLKSSATDMLIFMHAWLSGQDSPLAQLGVSGDSILSGSGQTSGYHCFLSLDRARQLGVVVLADTASLYVSELGNAIVSWLKDDIVVPVTLLQRYTMPVAVHEDWLGDYAMPANPAIPPGTILEIRQVESALTVAFHTDPSTPAASVTLSPLSPTSFFMKGWDVEFAFEQGRLKMTPGNFSRAIFCGAMLLERCEKETENES